MLNVITDSVLVYKEGSSLEKAGSLIVNHIKIYIELKQPRLWNMLYQLKVAKCDH
jgi:hypothetical protein